MHSKGIVAMCIFFVTFASLKFVSIILYIAGDLLIFLGRNSAACFLIGLVINGLGIYGIFGIRHAVRDNGEFTNQGKRDTI